jgi:TonB family protein
LNKRRSDKPLTIALCVSLTLHTALLFLLVHEQIQLLLHQLTPPTLADARPPAPPKQSEEEPSSDDPPPPIITPPAKPLIPLPPLAPEPIARPEPEKPKKAPSDQNNENIDWGEKDGKGFAITSAPGKKPMSARKGIEDQASASRDPEGPEAFPDDPSLNTVPPGENGDLHKPVKDPLANKGTQGTPAQTMGYPQAQPIPPAPTPDHSALASNDNAARDENTGQSTSEMPIAEKRSPADTNDQIAQRPGLANDPANPDAEQILPIKKSNIIGIASIEPAYPDVVEALTRPPGVKLSNHQSDNIQSPVLPNLVAADITTAPPIQPATAAIETKPEPLEEMAQKLGDADPRTGPAITLAMSHTPGDKTHEGGDSPLPVLASADTPSGSQILDAIDKIKPDEPRPEEMAAQLEPGVQTPPAPTDQSTPPGQVASATGGVPGPTVSAADPAPDTGLESDPFAKIPGVDFRDGKVEARSGRVVKPIRPRLNEAGRRDLLAMQFPTVVFKVRIDKTGKVKDVTVIQSSGSQAIDMPVYRALWQWWFEPPKDKKGNPLEDVQLVSIHWG